MFKMSEITHPNAWSAAKKKIEASSTITRTMIVEIEVSRRDGHLTFAVSERTCWMNVNGFVLDAIVYPRLYGA
jgi:hypothetical protein